MFPPKMAKGEETINIALPTAVVTSMTGRTNSASPVIASADGFSSIVLDQDIVGSAINTLTIMTFNKFDSVECIKPISQDSLLTFPLKNGTSISV